jgi:hypothetical protein
MKYTYSSAPGRLPEWATLCHLHVNFDPSLATLLATQRVRSAGSDVDIGEEDDTEAGLQGTGEQHTDTPLPEEEEEEPPEHDGGPGKGAGSGDIGTGAMEGAEQGGEKPFLETVEIIERSDPRFVARASAPE